MSDAVLGEAGTAAQFQITDGQLIQKGVTPLHAVVEPRADSTVSRLKVSWSRSKDTLGAFKFSGDTVEWTSSTITRPQTNVRSAILNSLPRVLTKYSSGFFLAGLAHLLRQ